MERLNTKRAKILLSIHLFFISIWFGGVMSWVPLVYGNDINNFDETYTTYLNMRAIAWNVIGWGGIGSLFTGLLNGLFTNWGLFKHLWVTVKLATVVCLILFGMFYLESKMLDNIAILEDEGKNALQNPDFISNHLNIKSGLIIEFLVFMLLVTISVFKPKIPLILKAK